MQLTKHEQKILDIINSNPEILDDPEKRSAIAERHGLTEKTLRNRIAEFKKYGLIQPNNSVIPANGDIDIVQIFNLIWQKKFIVVKFASILVSLAMIYLLVKTPLFTSTITMYPAGDLSQSKAVMGTNLSTIAESFGLAGLSSSPNYNIPDIVSSIRIKKEIATHHWKTNKESSPQQLIQYWEIDQPSTSPLSLIRSLFPAGNIQSNLDDKYLDGAVKELEDRISVSESGSGLITIHVDMEEPQLAADIANYVAEFVIEFVSKVQKSTSSKNRQFVEQQMKNASNVLKQSEVKMVAFQNQHPVGLDTPDLKMERLGLQRDIEENQTVYLTLRQQYEISRIDEQREEILINILDEAIPAVKVSKPKKSIVLLLAGFLGIALAIPVILYRDYPSL